MPVICVKNQMRRQSAFLTTVEVAVVMLVIGVAIGSVAFPMTKTTTVIQLSTSSSASISTAASQPPSFISPSTSPTTTITFTASSSHASETYSSCTLSPCQPQPTTINFATTTNATTNTGNGLTTVCIISAEGTINLIVVLDNTSIAQTAPLAGLPVVVGYYINTNCLLDFSPNEGIGTRTLNSSGMAVVCCMIGDYSFNFTYSGRNYYVIALVEPEKTTCVTVGIPSGKVNITFSQPYQNVC